MFTPDSGYYNRYSKNKNFYEWRNIAGEVPQSAELNEIQSLVKDLVQRSGDSILQNGDVVSGMFVQSKGETTRSFGATGSTVSLPVTLYETVGSGKIWIDGVVYDVPGSITNLPVPKASGGNNSIPLWGFLGIYLRKEVITAADDQGLYDPAVSDLNGTPLGLPGANRLKITPVWVAGTLSVSDFDDKKIQQLVGLTNSQNSLARLSFSTETTSVISQNSVYNAKVNIPSSFISDTSFTQMSILFSGEQFISLDSTVKFAIKVSNTGTGTISVTPQLFRGNQPVLSNVTPVVLANNITTDVSLVIDQSKLNMIPTNIKNCQIGLIISSTAQINQAADIYISDLHLEVVGESRKPTYKLFSTLSGSTYSSFIVGPANYIAHGNYNLLDLNTIPQPSSLNDSLLSQVPLGNGLNTLGHIIRDTAVTSEINETFVDTYGVSIEEALVRIYPVHITYNGQIVSSLPNREFTRLTDLFLSERLKNVTNSSVIEGMEVSAVPSGNSFAEYSVQISPGNAFVNGRLFMGVDPITGINAKGTKQGVNNLTITPFETTTITKTNPELIPFTSANDTYKISSGVFNDLLLAGATALFIEYMNHKDQDVYQETVFTDSSISLTELDTLHIEEGVDILKVYGRNGTIYERGIDWDPVIRVVNGVKKLIIGWHYYEATSTRRASRRPVNGEIIDIAYTALLKLTLPAAGQTESTHVKYIRNDIFNVGFQLKATSTNTNTSNYSILNSWTITPANPKVWGPILSFTSSELAFKSNILLYSYTTDQFNKYIVYFSGDVAKDGPDGRFGYEVLGSDQAELETLKNLQQSNKLPLALVSTPITNNSSIKNYKFRVTSVAEQAEINDKVSEFLKILPSILSQNILAGDISGSAVYGSYNTGAQYKQVESIVWDVDEGIFPALAGYKVEVRYSYYGDGLESNPTYSAYTSHLLSDPEGVRTDMLRAMIAKIKDNVGNVRKNLIVKLSYDTDTLDISDCESVVIE